MQNVGLITFFVLILIALIRARSIERNYLQTLNMQKDKILSDVLSRESAKAWDNVKGVDVRSRRYKKATINAPNYYDQH